METATKKTIATGALLGLTAGVLYSTSTIPEPPPVICECSQILQQIDRQIIRLMQKVEEECRK